MYRRHAGLAGWPINRSGIRGDPGSPQLNSFGPIMSLAEELLEQGEPDTVLEFFAECRKFWKLFARI